MNEGAGGLGRGGKEEVGSNRRHGVDAEQQNEEGRHERAAAHTGHPNQDTHAEAGQHIGQTGRGQRGHARLMLLGYSAQSSFEGDAQEELNGQASCEMHAWKRLRACAT